MTGNFIIPLYRGCQVSAPASLCCSPESGSADENRNSGLGKSIQRLTKKNNGYFSFVTSMTNPSGCSNEKNTLYVLSSLPLSLVKASSSTDSSYPTGFFAPVAYTSVNRGRFRFRNKKWNGTPSRDHRTLTRAFFPSFPSFLPSCFHTIFLLYLKADDPRRCRWHVDNDTPQLFKNE